jgi:hypothetical protein
MSASATVAHDQRIADAITTEESFLEALATAHAHRTRVHDHILETRGRAFAGELQALPDLDQLHDDLIAADHAIQDAELQASAAQAALRALQQQRAGIERQESDEHLAVLLQHRAAWAGRVDAAIDSLVATIRAYLAAAHESDGMAAACGVREDWIHDPTGPLVDRVLQRLKATAPTQFAQFSSGPPRPPLVETDRELTKRARARVEVRPA